MSALERRYRRWMVAYPAEYRRAHESEILATLLDAATPGQERPGLTEGMALLVGGLRARARLAALEPGRLWADGLRIAAIVLLVQICAFAISVAMSSNVVVDSISQLALLGTTPVIVVGAGAGLIALARARVFVALCALVVMMIVQVAANSAAHFSPPLPWLGILPVDWVLVAGLLAALARSRTLRSMSRPWSWRVTSLTIACIPLQTACFLALDGSVRYLPPMVVLPLFVLVEVVGPASVTLVWAVLSGDSRPALAATVSLVIAIAGQVQTLFIAFHFVSWAGYDFNVLLTVLVAGCALVVTAATYSSQVSSTGRRGWGA